MKMKSHLDIFLGISSSFTGVLVLVRQTRKTKTPSKSDKKGKVLGALASKVLVFGVLVFPNNPGMI